jgi:hypothetical protein
MKSILHPDFKYTPAASTDIRKTFARLRREAKAREQADQAEAVSKVRTLKRKATV